MTTYDEIAYPSYPFHYTHPDRLATLATLFGMKPAPVQSCRVLELGCSDGANLAAMAISLPQSEFVGVDSAATAIARGRDVAEKVGIKNLTLRALDLLEMSPEYGSFDYIIVHGLYTWVPEPVREQILAICRGSLAPQGVAYISYNTLPGCHIRMMLREMMIFHNRDFQDPKQRMQQALNLLKVLVNSQARDEPYSRFLRTELDRLADRSLEGLYHDELAEIFDPIYFHQLMEQAQRHNLQFLAEANFYEMMPRGLAPKGLEVLEKIGDDIVLREQYMDFMQGRFFRKTLLCHAKVPLNRSLKPDCVKGYYVSTFAEAPKPEPHADPAAGETFQCDNGAKLETPDPLGRSLFRHLIERKPERISFPQLVREAEERARQQFGFAPKEGQNLTADLAALVWNTFCAGMVDLHLYVPPFVVSLSERPVATPLARWQAGVGDTVSTLHQRTLKLTTTIQRGALSLLDGSRDRTALRADVLELFSSGKLELLGEDGKPIRDMTIVSKSIDDELEDFLQKAAHMAVLMG